MAEQRSTRRPLGPGAKRVPPHGVDSSGHRVPITSTIPNNPAAHVPSMFPFAQNSFEANHAMGASFQEYTPPSGYSQSYLSQRVRDAGLLPKPTFTTPTKDGRANALGSPFQTPTGLRGGIGGAEDAGAGKRLPSRFPKTSLESPIEESVARSIENGRDSRGLPASASFTAGPTNAKTPALQKGRRSSTEEPSHRPVRATRTAINYRKFAGISESPAPEDGSTPGPDGDISEPDNSLTLSSNRRFTRSGSSYRNVTTVKKPEPFLPENLRRLRIAMGADDFDEYCRLVRLHVEEEITDEELDIKTGRLCQINDAGAKRRIRKSVKNLVLARNRAEMEMDDTTATLG